MTPRCFAAWSDGKGKAARRRVEDAVVSSWLIAARTAEAMSGKLKPLDRILAKVSFPRKRRKQTPEEMLAILMQCQAGGAPISIGEMN